MINIKRAAKLYNACDFAVIEETNRWDTADDKRHVFLLQYSDGQALAIKVCRNAFTTPERVLGWQALCKAYLDLGIYCPQIVETLNGNASETMVFDGVDYIVYAEEAKRYKTFEEIDPSPDFEPIKETVVESIGKVAANCKNLLPFPSVFCLYTTFDATYADDENYENAETFCGTVKEHFPEHAAYADKIWELFLQKRNAFEPVHRALPRASFQSDLNRSNILVDDQMRFAGYIDFNLSGTESVLGYIVISEICGYRLKNKDLERLADAEFRKNCDAYFYKNIEIIRKNYAFSELETKNICLCYNTVYPFSCWAVNGLLRLCIKENKAQHVQQLLDWVHWQLSRDDIKI